MLDFERNNDREHEIIFEAEVILHPNPLGFLKKGHLFLEMLHIEQRHYIS